MLLILPTKQAQMVYVELYCFIAYPLYLREGNSKRFPWFNYSSMDCLIVCFRIVGLLQLFNLLESGTSSFILSNASGSASSSLKIVKVFETKKLCSILLHFCKIDP